MKKTLYEQLILFSTVTLTCAAVLTGSLSLMKPEIPDGGNTSITEDSDNTNDTEYNETETNKKTIPRNPEIQPQEDWEPETKRF